MKMKRLALIAVAAVMALGCFAGCGKEDTTIVVVSREDGSGTRGAFEELTGLEEKDADGNKKSLTTKEAIIQNSTDAVMTQVSGNKNAIGYISLGSLNDTVKAVDIDGVEAKAENVKNGTYAVSRPFNIAYKGELSQPAQDFVNYIMSKEGQEIIANNGYIAADEAAAAFASNSAEGKVVVTGSSSVTPVMEKLAEAYKKVNANVTVEIQGTDSSSGMSDALAGTNDIGMASRELKDSEAELTGITIAKDGIAVIVNKDSDVDALTMEQIKDIYTGSVSDWEDVK